MKLKTVTDYLSNEFANGIEEYYRFEGFGHVIGVFVRFENGYCYSSFEV